MTRPPLDAREILAAAGLRPKKSWGQNFLRDATVHQDIARAVGAGPDTPVVELGAGLGALTYFLLECGGKVVAIERDREIVPLLRENLASYPGLEIREANAAELDYRALATELGGPIHLAGNLPYQISSRILVSLADAGGAVARAVVLVQREVGERVASEPGSKTYGLLSVLVQRRFVAERVRSVPPGAFHPPPKVHSAVIRLTAKPASGRSAEEDGDLVTAARAGFCARRKSLRNALKGSLAITDADRLSSALAAADIDGGRRAETLSVDEFNRLGRSLRAGGLLNDSAGAGKVGSST